MTTFDKPEYLDAFERFRRMPRSIFNAYFGRLQLPEFSTGRFLDVGSGPGLQTEMLLGRLPTSWRVVAIEPSVQLAASAQARLAKFGSHVSIIECSFEAFSSKNTFSAVWMSEVAHLLGEVPQWAARLANVMQPGGRVLIRTSTHTQLKHRHWYQFFPTALEVDLGRHPSRRSVFKGLTNSGFSQVSSVTIDESRRIPVELLVTMMREKAFSTLHYLSKFELDKGIQLLQRTFQGKSTTRWHYEMTAYTATYQGGKR